MTRQLPVILLMTLLTMASGEEAVSPEAPSILTKSPFLPPDFQPPGRPGQSAPEQKKNGQYEFRGVYELGGIYHYNLFDARENKGFWTTKADAEARGFEILNFDSSKNALVLRVDGETQDLKLIETSDKPMAMQGSKAASARPAAGTKARKNPTARRRVIRPQKGKPPTRTSGGQNRRVIARPPQNP